MDIGTGTVCCKCSGLTLIHIWRECVFSALGHNGLIQNRGRAKVISFVNTVHFQCANCVMA